CKAYLKNKKKPRNLFAQWLDRLLGFLCDLYLTIIRGTPMMVQVLIFCWIIFAKFPISMNFYAAMIAFGINSGAYVAEIVRAGINAVNIGQTEAGRSLGLTGGMTMRFIVLPQAIKNILPALANEAIMLVKETAIVGYAAQQDITYVATMIRSRTYSPVPLLFIALVYLIIVMLMTYGTRKLERRLARSDRS
ncbi:MAG: amino acid ABC transporter permease, partial [Clostridia bacterium]|nr:amino acid ABC transporter permease [Clostridia bacterium]